MVIHAKPHVDHILPCPRIVNDVSNNLPADTVPHLDDDVVQSL